MKRTLRVCGLLGIAGLVSGCTQTTPAYGLHVSGTDDLADVDVAWFWASSITGLDPFVSAHDNWISASFQAEPIILSTQEGEYHGVSVETYATVQVVDNCLLDVLSPTVHEFVHVQWYLLTGDSDPNHMRQGWHRANGDFGPCMSGF